MKASSVRKAAIFASKAGLIFLVSKSHLQYSKFVSCKQIVSAISSF
jgi:hypothetical protein